ncbi:MAG TPA: sodium/proton antiporter NhaB [Pseudobacteroides sp.]|uniref:sodium/proton antiporter NhaB n=1 Tax=Pseudobacteroides sp. TaxID=1968840 RepID=UPI002F93FF44
MNSFGKVILKNFLGKSPQWYKYTIIAFLLINPIIYFFINPFLSGWVLVAEFIFTLALALKCYPLPASGLLAIEAVIIGMTSADTVYKEVSQNLPIILLLMFMVAGIHFMKDGLLVIFSKILVSVKSKVFLSLIFCILGAFLSAFLDALTVTAVIIAVAYSFYNIFHKYSSKLGRVSSTGEPDHFDDDLVEYAGVTDDSSIPEEHKKDLDQFRGFLRNLMMHGAVGTALGGATTIVGEPQNLLIGTIMKWSFADFFLYCSRISIPVLIVGLFVCLFLELTGIMGYGYKLPDKVRAVLENENKEKAKKMDAQAIARLAIQAIVGVLLIIALALHLAEVGLIGLLVIILLTAFNGITEEHQFGAAFHEALPFTSLLVVFFAIVAVIHDLHLFSPVIDLVLSIEGRNQLISLFLANGILSAISDNVFVATVYIKELQAAFEAGAFSYEWYTKLAAVVNMGTNIPSVATPNGQAAFLFLLTSSLAPVIRLSFMSMVKLALPYTIALTATGLLATMFLL